MELQFKRHEHPCLDTAVREIRNMELTQEIRLPDGMPDIGQILCAWGQNVLRGKEWRSDSVSFSGGMMVWVLYAPEDGTPEQCVEAWIPFQMNWDLPENSPEGVVRIQCIPRFVDARSVSARRIMVRAGTAAQAEAWVPRTLELWEPESVPEDVELLKTRWPVRVNAEAGEKTFLLDEEPAFSGGGEMAEKIISFRLDPKLLEKKVLGNKLVFRGSGELHVLCRCSDGTLRSWDLTMPFSQFAELEGEYGPDALADLIVSPTSLELELEENGRLRFKGGLVAQYLISDKLLMTVAEDAYSPGREVQLQMETVEVPTVLETRRENLYGEQTLPGEAARIVDVSFLPDFPRQRAGEDGMELVVTGQFQGLYYGPDGVLRSGTTRWEGGIRMPADENTRLLAVPAAESARAVCNGERITFSSESSLEVTAVKNQQFSVLTGLELGQSRQKDPERPSLILRRAGEERLWDIAKANGSTMEAIRRINGFQEEPASDRLLLIPIP